MSSTTPVLDSTNPVLLRTSMYYSSTTLYCPVQLLSAQFQCIETSATASCGYTGNFEYLGLHVAFPHNILLVSRLDDYFSITRLGFSLGRQIELH